MHAAFCRQLICFAIFLTPVSAADLSISATKQGSEIVTLRGDIAPGDADRLKDLIRAANHRGRLVSGIHLSSDGGNLLEGAKLADVIRAGVIASVVPKGSNCASACFLVFAAGSEKFVNYQARVGVHGASDENGNEAGDATVAMARIVKDLGVPSSIIGRMVITSPAEMVWLSPSDLQSMGAKMIGKPSQISGLHVDPSYPPAQPRSVQATSTAVTWQQIVKEAMALSSSQNGGNPSINRLCQPTAKACSTAVFFRSNSGRRVMVRAVEDLRGNIVMREVCEFNDFEDNRLCANFDTKQTHRDLKDAQGNWSLVSAE